MKKIGILTFWNVPNYGTFLQAYALQKVISSLNKDNDVKQIAYLNARHYNAYYSLNNRKYRLGLLDPRAYLNTAKRLFSGDVQRLKPFLNYYKDFIPCTQPMTEDDLAKEPFDTVVLGSDIVWDYSISFFGDDKYLYGNSLNCNNIIAYAASFGTVKDTMPCPSYVKEGLQKMTAISVRDENSRHLVNKFANREATIVCDPTILWNFNTDTNIPNTDKEDKYIIVYGSNFKKELISGCIDYARKNNLKIYCLDSLNDTFDWCDKNIKQDKLNPFQWLAYFKNAEKIFTCTYHGLMFGLIFNKRTVFSPTQFILDKASSLISFLGLEDVLINYNTFAEKADWKWDYTEINSKLDELRQKSSVFLHNNL
ncbi:MAG: polysaccharide pyruvyl transferase family protein [Bacteroidales bacterium]|nr:polysaccharide pyruvyl transferase family protein [Bacteroidales bacterium]